LYTKKIFKSAAYLGEEALKGFAACCSANNKN